MATIPAEPALSAEEAYQLLQDWYAVQQQLQEVRSREMAMRKRLAQTYFPTAHEGTQRLPLGEGFELALTFGYTRTVDEAVIDAVKASDLKKYKLQHVWEDLITYTPKLSTLEYRGLSVEQQGFVDSLLIIKEAAPKLAIVSRAEQKQENVPITRDETKPKKVRATKKTTTKRAPAKKAAKKATRKEASK